MSRDKDPTQRLYDIVRQGLCIGCGLCQSVAGKDTISVKVSSSGYEFPVVIGNLDHDTVDRIYDVCPGTRIDGLPERLINERTHVDNVWGPWHTIVNAWAGDPQVRFEGSTGGFLTALSCYLIESGEVDFILHARASVTHPTYGERHISLNIDDVMEGAGSRYGPTAVLIDIDDVLAREQQFAFVGKPCDIAALRNYARYDDRVDKLVKYWLTPVCGGIMPPESMNNFLKRIDINPDDVKKFRYRGRGCPGPTRVETSEQVIEKHYLDFWGDDESQWSLPHRCKICPDGIGEGADIVAADTWVSASPKREETDSDPGTNAVIVRTKAGQNLLDQAVAAGAIVLGEALVPDEMSHYQMHQVRKKYTVWSRYQALDEEGRIVPQTHGLRIAELASTMPETFNSNQREGARQRIRTGKATIDYP